MNFTRAGLHPGHDCYEASSGAWNLYASGSPRSYLITGQGQLDSNPDEERFQQDAPAN